MRRLIDEILFYGVIVLTLLCLAIMFIDQHEAVKQCEAKDAIAVKASGKWACVKELK